jgi:twitching motility protein PilI
MARRDALRELQSRLAERLQQARSEDRSASWLALECAGQGLLVSLPSAGEIFPVGALSAVPHTRAWFLGVANLRGQLHGVVDFAAFLGLRTSGTGGGRDQARLVALNPALGANCALLVDRLAGLRSSEQLRPLPPAAEPRPGLAGPCFEDEKGRSWQVIDLAVLARMDQFLAVAA